MFSKRILLFDTITDGHHPDYLYNFILYYSEKTEVELHILTGKTFAVYLQQYLKDGILPWTNIVVHYIPQEEIQKIHQKSIFIRSFLEWKLMKEYALKLGIKKVLLMYMDYFQLGIIFSKKSDLEISGIYFRPDFAKNPNSFYSKIKKLILVKTMNSGHLKNLFTLEEKVVPELQKLSKKTKVCSICEPVQLFSLTEDKKISFAKIHQIPQNKILFLNFGYLDERKGIEVFLKACQQLSKDQLNSIALMLVGPIEKDYESKINDLISHVDGLQTCKMWGYLATNEIQITFDLADWALVLYQNHLGSSSVLVRAALAGKPVLGTDLGQIGELTNQRKLGLALDASNPADIAKAIIEIIEKRVKINHSAIQQFANENSIEAFGNVIDSAI